ncbi:MAG: helix-turn-helix domain-containing protein [Dysgonamonadaceae bacterium]|nr:helix-turn-helix domain-containing protein [Dysgonamonadaceae bacterium]
MKDRLFIPNLKGLLCLFICFISTTTIYGQNDDFQHKKDSLLKVIASTKGEEKLKAYRELTFLRFPDEETDLELQYITDFIREARKQQNKEYENRACKMELIHLNNHARYDEFERKAKEYLPVFKKNGSYRDYYESYSFLLQSDGKEWNVKRKIEGIDQMYAEAKQDNYLYGIVQATYLMAEIYSSEDRYEDSEKYFQETIKNALKLIKEEPDQATNYYLVSNAYHGLACILIDQEKLDKCVSLLSVWKKHTMTFEKTFGYPDGYLSHYYQICAHTCLKKEKYDEAELYCDSMMPRLFPMHEYKVWDIKATICEKRGEYDNAIDYTNKTIDLMANYEIVSYYTISLLKNKASILNKMGRTEEAYLVSEMAFQQNDSIRMLENGVQLDKARAQYEIDKHIVEKKHLRNYLLFAIGCCILLAIALGIWIYLNRKITQRNRILVQQINELISQQKEQINEILDQTSDNDLYIESRMDKLSTTLRDLLLKDKIYRNPALTQELVIKILGTNKGVFPKAFKYCFEMPFKDYINSLRLKDAVQLLEQSDLSIEEISDIAGFGTVRTFYNQFNAKYNMAPQNYRLSFRTQ